MLITASINYPDERLLLEQDHYAGYIQRHTKKAKSCHEIITERTPLFQQLFIGEL